MNLFYVLFTLQKHLFQQDNLPSPMDKDRSFIDQMTKMIIRPHRDIYSHQKLGSPQMIIKTRISNDHTNYKYLEINRIDQTLILKGKKIHLSYYDFVGNGDRQKGKPSEKDKYMQRGMTNKRCIIYLHTNSGSRLQGLDLVKLVLPFGSSMAIFDYRGSGISDGEYTSMGVNESQDLEHILLHLKRTQGINQFSLWGRSMGAVTILYYLTKQYFQNHIQHSITIKSIVLDSPFSSMKKLMFDIAASKINLPQFVFLPVINSIMQKVALKIGADLIKELDLLERLKLVQVNKDHYKSIMKINALFLTSPMDKLVNTFHVELLHQKFPFYLKELFYFNGQHNQNRSDGLKIKCAQFLCEMKVVNSGGNNSMAQREKGVMNLQFKKGVEENKKDKEHYMISSKEGNSPKFRLKKDARVKTEDPNQQHLSRQPIKTSKVAQETRHLRVQTQYQSNHPNNHPNNHANNHPTIIINNNYNVSVNLYDQPQNLKKSEFIPPINFSKLDQSQQGYMTDRLTDNHFPQKYYLPQSVKLQKKEANMINQSQPIHTHQPFNSHLNYTQMPRNNQDKFMGYSSLDNMSMSYAFRDKKKAGDQLREEKPVEIPLIKFEGVDYKTYIKPKRQLIFFKEKAQEKEHQKGSHMMPRLSEPPILEYSSNTHTTNVSKSIINMYSSNEAQIQSIQSEKSKISLAELRKIQKKEHENCSTKTSKIISVKSKPQYLQLQKAFINLQSSSKKLDQQRPSFHIENDRVAFGNNSKMMKTSLMSKNRQIDRKNSETIQDPKQSLISSKHSKAPQRPFIISKASQKTDQIQFRQRK